MFSPKPPKSARQPWNFNKGPELTNYSPLEDVHLGYHFSRPAVKKQLVRTCIATRDGFLLPQDHSTAKLAIIEQEFDKAYQIAQRRIWRDEFEKQKAQSTLQIRETYEEKKMKCAQRREHEQKRAAEYQKHSNEFSYSKNLARVASVRWLNKNTPPSSAGVVRPSPGNKAIFAGNSTSANAAVNSPQQQKNYNNINNNNSNADLKLPKVPLTART
eukprot:PhF_6_TR26167/c0_g1_i1/m.37152